MLSRVLRGKCDLRMHTNKASEFHTTTWQAIFLPLSQSARVCQRDQKIPEGSEGSILVDCLQSAFSLRSVEFLDNIERLGTKNAFSQLKDWVLFY